MAIVYLDSSVAIRTILDVPERLRLQDWLDQPGVNLVSSRLLRTEVVRVMRRSGRALSDATPLLDGVGLFDLTRDTHAVAQASERHLRALAALHLATELLRGESVTVATHDAAMKAVAEHLGLSTVDPVAMN